LEDLSDFSLESGVPDYPLSPEVKLDPRTPIQSSSQDFLTSGKGKSETSTSYAMMGAQQNRQGSAGLSWWSPKTPAKSGSEQDDKGKNSPIEGVVQPVALITLPPPREVAILEIQRNCLPTGNLNEEEWVIVYGYCLFFLLSFMVLPIYCLALISLHPGIQIQGKNVSGLPR
jgi:nuclear pore complex protein Nup53